MHNTMHVKWNPDFSNLPGKRKLVKKIGHFEKSELKLQLLIEEKQLLVRVIRRFEKWGFHTLITKSHLYLNHQHTDSLLSALSDFFGERAFAFERKITQQQLYSKQTNLISLLSLRRSKGKSRQWNRHYLILALGRSCRRTFRRAFSKLMVTWRTSGSTGRILRIDFRTCKWRKERENVKQNNCYLFFVLSTSS